MTYATANPITHPTPPRIPPRSVLIRLLIRRWDYRSPRFWLRLRLACASWNLVLGTLLVSSGHWIGQFAWLGLISLTGSALLFVTAFHLRRYIQGEPSKG